MFIMHSAIPLRAHHPLRIQNFVELKIFPVQETIINFSHVAPKLGLVTLGQILKRIISLFPKITKINLPITHGARHDAIFNKVS